MTTFTDSQQRLWRLLVDEARDPHNTTPLSDVLRGLDAADEDKAVVADHFGGPGAGDEYRTAFRTGTETQP